MGVMRSRDDNTHEGRRHTVGDHYRGEGTSGIPGNRCGDTHQVVAHGDEAGSEVIRFHHPIPLLQGVGGRRLGS